MSKNLVLRVGRDTGKKVKVYPEGRLCEHCGAPLSVYNPNKNCWAYFFTIQLKKDEYNEQWCRKRNIFMLEGEGGNIIILKNRRKYGKKKLEGGDVLSGIERGHGIVGGEVQSLVQDSWRQWEDFNGQQNIPITQQLQACGPAVS